MFKNIEPNIYYKYFNQLKKIQLVFLSNNRHKV
jgi:hypothetical protein